MEIKLDVILQRLPVLKVVGRKERLIRTVVNAGATSFDERDVMWVSDKNSDLLKKISDGIVIVSANTDESYFNHRCTYLIVGNPRLFFLNMVKAFFVEATDPPSVSDRSVIDPSVTLGKGVTIRAGAVLERNCHVGDGSIIDSNTVVKKGTVIGKRVKIGANNTIGGEGFGYEKDESGQFEVLPHLGNVVIEDDVEIGNNTTIDRAVIGSTVIRRNAKIDNLVHIAHGVEIGENSLIIANAMIAGSCIIGKNAWVAPSASVLNKLIVGDDAVVGIGAVVLKNVSAGQTVVGNPAKDITTVRKQPK
jgi:UDP-3-O-[3-hydroxymyristoyl] glucosamine N-acyltransferase